MFVLTRFHHTLKELSHGLCILIHMCSVYCNYQLVSLFIASVVHEGVSSGPQVSYIHLVVSIAMAEHQSYHCSYFGLAGCKFYAPTHLCDRYL